MVASGLPNDAGRRPVDTVGDPVDAVGLPVDAGETGENGENDGDGSGLSGYKQFTRRALGTSALDNVRVAEASELALKERFYAMQVKQKDKAGRPDIDAFETAKRRAKCEKGFFVSFEYSSDALREIDRFFREEHHIIVPLTVREILDQEIARKLA